MRPSRFLYRSNSSPRRAPRKTSSKPGLQQPPRQCPGPTSQDTRTPSVASTAKAPIRAKPLLYALAVSATTIAGTWWGATLKEEWQTRESGVETAESTREGEDVKTSTAAQGGAERMAKEKADKQRQEQIEVLLDRRARLVTVREELARKIEDLKARQEERDRLGLREVGVDEKAQRRNDG